MTRIVKCIFTLSYHIKKKKNYNFFESGEQRERKEIKIMKGGCECEGKKGKKIK